MLIDEIDQIDSNIQSMNHHLLYLTKPLAWLRLVTTYIAILPIQPIIEAFMSEHVQKV